MREGADKQTLRDSIFGDLRNAAHHSLVLKHPVEASYCSINQPSERGQHKKTAATKKEQHPRVSKYFGRPSNNLDRIRCCCLYDDDGISYTITSKMERVTKQKNTKTFSARGGKFGKKTWQKLFAFSILRYQNVAPIVIHTGSCSIKNHKILRVTLNL